MPLDKYERKDSIEQTSVVPGSGYRAAGEMWGQVGKTARIAEDVVYEHDLKKAEQTGGAEGEKAVWVDPDTNTPHVVGTLPDGTRPYAVAYRKAAEGRYQAELGLASMAKAAELGNTYSANPEAFRHSWAGYMKGITDSVPESIRPDTDLMLKEAGVKKYYQLQQEDFQRTMQEGKVATLNLVDAFERDSVDTLRGSGLAGGSPQFLHDKFNQAHSMLADQVSSGILTPQEGNTRYQDFKFRMMRGMISGEAIKMVTGDKPAKDGDVDKFLDSFKRTPSQDVDDFQRDQIANFAKGEVATELTKIKAKQNEAIGAAKRQAKDAQDTWWKGENYALDERQVMRIAEFTGDSEVVANTYAALNARSTIKEFNALSPQQQEARISELNKPGAEQTPDTLKLREKLETEYTKTSKAIESGETLQLASGRGFVTTDPIDFTNPTTLQKRAADVNSVDHIMGAESKPLLPTEKEKTIRLLDGSDSEGKIDLYRNMKENMGQDITMRAMRQIGQDRPATAMAMTLSDDAPDVARTILMGDLALKADKNILGESNQYATGFQSYIGTALQGDDTLRNAVYQSALAVQADGKKRNPGLGLSDFQKAIDTVTGGIAEYHNFKTIVPKRGMSSGDFEYLVDGLSTEQFWQAAGGHKLVTLSGQEVVASTITGGKRGIFEWVGDGQYILKLNINNSLSGQTVFMANEKGELIKDESGRPVPAELNLKSFVGE